MWSFGCREDKIRKPRFPFALELISYPYKKYIFQYFLLLNTFWKFNGIFKPLYTRNFRWYEIIFLRYEITLWCCWQSYNLDTLAQYPSWIHPGKFPGENLFRKITPQRNTSGSFTSQTILHNLFHPGKNTGLLIVPSEFLNINRWVLILPLWYYLCSMVCGKISLESRQCEVTLPPEF